jgi:hypothetical protein
MEYWNVVISLHSIDVTPTTGLEPALAEKYARLQTSLRDMGRVLVAYSGGVDSTLIAKVARDVLGADALAVMAISPSYAEAERPEAIRLLAEIGIAHRIVETDEVSDPRYAANPANRCYFCKEHLFEALSRSRGGGLCLILDGFNADVVASPPGRQAGRERGVRSRSRGRADQERHPCPGPVPGPEQLGQTAMACLSAGCHGSDHQAILRDRQAETLLRGWVGPAPVRHQTPGPIGSAPRT